MVVFARFQNDLDVIARLAQKMKRPHFEISGRVKNLDEWNERGGVLAVQIQAGGLGLDLTAARYCVYYSLGFNLGDYLQSIARLHRPGQTSLVDYIHLVASESIDEIIVEALAAKEDVINRILETKDGTNGSLGRSRWTPETKDGTNGSLGRSRWTPETKDGTNGSLGRSRWTGPA